MARVEIVRGARVRLRRPWLAFLWTLVTFGIYYLVWYYRTNAELRSFGRELRDAQALDISPGLATLAISLGSLLIVPPFISEWRYFRRIAKAQELAGMEHRISHVTGFLLWLIAFFVLPFEVPYAQHHLNRLWRHELEEEEKRRLGMRGGLPTATR